MVWKKNRKNITYELNILGISCSLGSNNRLSIFSYWALL
jgi:hypothetical protein